MHREITLASLLQLFGSSDILVHHRHIDTVGHLAKECCSLTACRKSWVNSRFSETKGSTLNMSSDSIKYKRLVLAVKHGSVILGAPCGKGHYFSVRGRHLRMRMKVFFPDRQICATIN